MPSWLAVTGRIRQEMRVRLPCVGAYLGLSWGTNSKASLCSSCFEGTANHLSAPCITENKGCKYWMRSTNLKTLHLGNQQKKKRKGHFMFWGQYFIFINLAKIILFTRVTNLNFYVAFLFTCIFHIWCVYHTAPDLCWSSFKLVCHSVSVISLTEWQKIWVIKYCLSAIVWATVNYHICLECQSVWPHAHSLRCGIYK